MPQIDCASAKILSAVPLLYMTAIAGPFTCAIIAYFAAHLPLAMSLCNSTGYDTILRSESVTAEWKPQTHERMRKR